ncbi:MAG: hypothetical protein ACE5R6_15945 [Candidatus Heimdallarchaeota archaeon]
MDKVKVLLDTNFFIYVLQDNHTNFDIIGDTCQRLGYELYTTNDVWHEIQRQYMRTKSKPYITDWIDLSKRKSEFTSFQSQAKQLLRSLPQIPDLSLVFAAKEIGDREVRIVSSDYKLLDSIPYLAPEIHGIANSVFALELHEKETDPQQKKKLYRIHEEIYSKEIEYSLERKEVYYPLSKIKLINEQAINVVRQIHSPQLALPMFAHEELVDLGPGVLLVKSIENIRERESFVEDIEAERYDMVIHEIEELQQRIDADLAVYLLSLDPTVYSALIRQISADLVLFRYFCALARLYRGQTGDIEMALQEIEKAVEILKYTSNPSLDLRIIVPFLQNILLILNEEFERAEQYFSLLQSKAEEWGFETELKASEGIYLALVALRGYESADIPTLRDPSLVTTFLLDLARHQFARAAFTPAAQVLQQVVAVSTKYELQAAMIETLSALLLLYYANPDNKQLSYSIMEEIFRIYNKKGWRDNFITNMHKELSEPQKPLYRLQKKRFTSLERLPKKLTGSWMDVFCVEKLPEEKTVLLYVRNWELDANLGIFVNHHQSPLKVTAGDRIRLAAGKYKCLIPKSAIEKKHSTRLCVVPDERSEILTRGRSGFRVLRTVGSTSIEVAQKFKQS